MQEAIRESGPEGKQRVEASEARVAKAKEVWGGEEDAKDKGIEGSNVDLEDARIPFIPMPEEVVAGGTHPKEADTGCYPKGWE